MNRRAKFKRAKASRQAKQDARNIRALYRAIEQGDLALVRTCFKEVTTKDIQENAAFLLSHAIQVAHDKSIEAGAERLEIIKFLLEQNLEITNEILYKAYKLSYGGVLGQETIFNLFLDTDRLTFYPDSKEHHKLFFIKAIEEGYTETVGRSLDKLDVARTNLFTFQCLGLKKFSIIEWALMNNQPEIAELLFDFYQTWKNILNVDESGYNETRILQAAVCHGNVKITQELLPSSHLKLDQPMPDYYRSENQDLLEGVFNVASNRITTTYKLQCLKENVAPALLSAKTDESTPELRCNKKT